MAPLVSKRDPLKPYTEIKKSIYNYCFEVD